MTSQTSTSLGESPRHCTADDMMILPLGIIFIADAGSAVTSGSLIFDMDWRTAHFDPLI
jgi:hypothetical protein